MCLLGDVPPTLPIKSYGPRESGRTFRKVPVVLLQTGEDFLKTGEGYNPRLDRILDLDPISRSRVDYLLQGLSGVRTSVNPRSVVPSLIRYTVDSGQGPWGRRSTPTVTYRSYLPSGTRIDRGKGPGFTRDRVHLTSYN